ncbi:MAG: rod shape-determining protein MreC [Candidatus Staskawiczbacteria bacterium]|nr:rod shape-determining protein MreC [Candidatus Staskawiczbacteria bacterium]
MNSFKNFSINKKNNSWVKILIGGIVVLAVLFILNIFVSPIRNSFYAISSPIQKTFWTAGESASNFCSSLFSGGALSKENANLKSENQKLLSQVAALQSIEQGNQAQSDVSASCQNSGFSLLMAGVNGLDNDILFINKGSADGVDEGMPVINQQNALFGKVIKVYKNFSQVMLISNKNSVVNVKIQQPDVTKPEIDGVVKGSGGLSAFLDLIPVDSNINVNDVLVTSALDKSFPKDLLVAKIIQKEKNDQKPFQQAQINLFSNVKTADNLFVITNYKQN